ncbi:MAG TPA: hypothetical protein VGJ31_06740 [Dongiaceae bacterium]
MAWLRSLLLTALLAMGAVLLLQFVYAFALIEVGSHTDMAAARTHILQAYDDGVLDPNEHPRWFFNRGGHTFTECTAWNLTLDDGRSAIDIAFLPRLQYEFDRDAPCTMGRNIAAAIPATKFWVYHRYWHGYRLYTWPMIQWFSLQTVRFINAFLILGAVVWFFRELRATIGNPAAGIFFIVFMSLTDIWRIWVNTPHSVAMFIILTGAALFARIYRKRPDPRLAIILAAVLGSIFNFFDFLSTPPMAPLLLAFFVITADEGRSAPADRRPSGLLLAGLVAASWFGGYALTWVAKWVLIVLISPDFHAAIADIVNQIELRTYGQENGGGHIYFIPLLPTALMTLQSFISVGSVAVAVLFAALVLHLRRNWAAFDGRKFLRISAPVLIATLWFEILSNHTQTHSHFTYRSQSTAIAILFTAAVMAISAPTGIPAMLRDLWAASKRIKTRRSG